VVLASGDYDDSSGTSIVLTSGAADGDILGVYLFDTFSVADTVSASAGGTFSGPVDFLDDVNVDSGTLFVDSANNRVGIGTSSPSAILHVVNSESATDDYKLQVSAFRPSIVLEDLSLSPSTDFQLECDGGSLKFLYGDASTNTQLATEAARIDSSGNLLLGKSSSNFGQTEGFEFLEAGPRLYMIRDGGTPMEIGRLSSDGTLIDFSKDGSQVGTIGNSGSRPFIASTDGGLRFGTSGGFPIVTPTNGNGKTADGGGDLGVAGGVFRDLYLSGGVYLGGTGSANKLDDYETGTWTPVITSQYGAASALDTIETGNYVKTGKKVYVQARITASSPLAADPAVDRIVIGNIPFSAQDTESQQGTGTGFCINSTNGNTAEIFAMSVQSSNNSIVAWAVSEHGSANLAYISFGVVYETND